MREDGFIQMTKQKMPLKAWLPLIGMTVSAFIFNTSEFMPIGLLSDIAANFGITESHAGLLISVYSWVVTLLSLPLMQVIAGNNRSIWHFPSFIWGFCQLWNADGFQNWRCLYARNFLVSRFSNCSSTRSRGAPNACHEYDCDRNIGCYDFRVAAGQSHRVNRWLANDLFMCSSGCIFGAVLSAVCISEDVQRNTVPDSAASADFEASAAAGYLSDYVSRSKCLLYRLQLY